MLLIIRLLRIRLIGVKGGDSSGNEDECSSIRPGELKAPQERSDEEVGKIELYLSALLPCPRKASD